MTVDARQIIPRMREGRHFYNQSIPHGQWTFAGTKNLQITHRFDPEEIDFTWVYAYPEDLGELEVELWANRNVLPPGRNVTLREEIEVRPVP